MHIVHVINQFPPNITAGLGRYAESLAPHLTRDHLLSVFTLNDGRLPAREQDGNLTVYRPVGRLLRALLARRQPNRTRRLEFLLLAVHVMVSNVRHVRGIRALHRRGGVDVIAIHDVTNFVAAFLCHLLLPVPIVFHLHTTEYSLAPRRTVTDPFMAGRAIERRIGRIAARVVTASPEVRDLLVADGWAPDRIDVVLLGNPLERAVSTPAPAARARQLRQDLGVPEQCRVLLFVGRLEVQKGIFPLVEAMERIVAADPEVHLVVLGQGDRDRVLACARERGVADHVHVADGFLGRDDLVVWYRLADVCVFPSLFEPFGLVAVEAMSTATPVVLGNGFSQVFLGDPDQPAARYVRAADPAHIAEVTLQVLADPQLRRDLGERGRALVRERFDWRRTAEATLAVYRCAARDPDRPWQG